MTTYNIELLSITDQVAWVKTEDGQYFGIVNAFKVLDGDFNEIAGKSVVDLLDSIVDIDQDYEREANIIEFREENGETIRLIITSDGVDIEEA